MKFGLVVGCHWVCANVLCFLLLREVVHKKHKGGTWTGTWEVWETYAQKMWMDSGQGEFDLCGQGLREELPSLSFCSLQPLLSVLNHCHSLGVFCSLLSRLQEDTVQRLRMGFWALPRRRSSATARPLCMRCCRRRGAGAGWAWISQPCSLWGSKTSEKRQMPTSWMWLKKTGKEKELCSVKSSEGEKEVLYYLCAFCLIAVIVVNI